ncbi:MAG: XRE family transcriptional regulator [Sphingobacteriales bacterium]|nr:MAG: XRE family transcriptional regulator [Sphingobacteriales bacterium]
MENESKPKHIGRNISRIRELRNMKQEALAQAMGVTQQAISNLENSAAVDESRLEDVAKALGVSAEAIKAFSDEGVINYFSTHYDNSTGPFGPYSNVNCNFNPLDKVVELYERMLEMERERNRLLEDLLKK